MPQDGVARVLFVGLKPLRERYRHATDLPVGSSSVGRPRIARTLENIQLIREFIHISIINVATNVNQRVIREIVSSWTTASC